MGPGHIFHLHKISLTPKDEYVLELKHVVAVGSLCADFISTIIKIIETEETPCP